MPEHSHRHLTLIKGGKITEQEFLRLPHDEKLSILRQQSAKKRLSLLLADSEGKALAESLQPQELYWMVRELGETDALELFMLASPEQYTFMLDMELWEKYSFSPARALTWLGYLVEAGEETVALHLPHLDFELLLLLLKGQISVGGGIGDLINDEQRLSNWDHSFDNIFHITFLHPEHSRVVGTLLDIIYRNDHSLYLAIMTGVQNEIESELEELAWQFRTGRLADLGFPPLEEAVAIYAWSDPERFVAAGEKVLRSSAGEEAVPQPVQVGEELLGRALALAHNGELQEELNYLINNALVAEETTFGDTEEMEAVCRRVYGYLNIALEQVAGADDHQAAAVLKQERFVHLFQLGHSLAVRLRKQAEDVSSDSYAVNKVLIGLKATRPNFYRGLDEDRVDGYREFRTLGDIRTVEEFLRHLKEGQTVL